MKNLMLTINLVKRSLFIGLFILITVVIYSISQYENFHSLFKRINFTKKIISNDAKAYKDKLLKNKIESKKIINMFENIDSSIVFEHSLVPMYRFPINSFFEAYVIEEIPEANLRRKIFLFVYDKKQKIFVQVIEIAYLYSYEGSQGRRECFVIDLNNDGSKDLIMMKYEESTLSILDNKGNYLKTETLSKQSSKVLLFKNQRYRPYSGYLH